MMDPSSEVGKLLNSIHVTALEFRLFIFSFFLSYFYYCLQWPLSVYQKKNLGKNV